MIYKSQIGVKWLGIGSGSEKSRKGVIYNYDVMSSSKFYLVVGTLPVDGFCWVFSEMTRHSCI